MKLKLAQRVVISYYRTKLKAISYISVDKAAKKAFDLFCTPYSGKPKRKAPPIFKHAEKISFIIEGIKVRGFHWMPENPTGKKILIVHGFDSCCYKFDRYISPLKKMGYEVYAFDAPGHGISDGKFINSLLYSRMILEIDKLYGPIYGIMAHSLGGLAASLAFEKLKDTDSKKLILIAPAVDSDYALDHFCNMLRLDNVLKTSIQELILSIAKQPLSYFSTARAIKNFNSTVLWLHDKEDRICPYSHVMPVIAAQPAHIKFFITENLGHSGIYKDNKVKKEILAFLAPVE